jgi:hypothetical protein
MPKRIHLERNRNLVITQERSTENSKNEEWMGTAWGGRRFWLGEVKKRKSRDTLSYLPSPKGELFKVWCWTSQHLRYESDRHLQIRQRWKVFTRRSGTTDYRKWKGLMVSERPSTPASSFNRLGKWNSNILINVLQQTPSSLFLVVESPKFHNLFFLSPMNTTPCSFLYFFELSLPCKIVVQHHQDFKAFSIFLLQNVP